MGMVMALKKLKSCMRGALVSFSKFLLWPVTNKEQEGGLSSCSICVW